MSAAPDRITEELKAVGVTAYGRLKRPSRLLHTLLRDDEHIEAAAYGQGADGSAMLVATNKRVLFVEANLLYSSSDDFGYDVISGVNHQESPLFGSVTLFTKVHTYHLEYASRESAMRFVKLIEDRVAGAGDVKKDLDLSYEEPERQVHYATLSDEARDFLHSQETMVVSTAARTGQVHSAVVYYTIQDDVLYMLTKKETAKSHNLIAGKGAAVVVYDAATKRTAQLQTVAEIVGDPEVSEEVFTTIGAVMHGGVENLPIAQLDAGGYIVFALRPTEVKYHDYGSSKQY